METGTARILLLVLFVQLASSWHSGLNPRKAYQREMARRMRISQLRDRSVVDSEPSPWLDPDRIFGVFNQAIDSTAKVSSTIASATQSLTNSTSISVSSDSTASDQNAAKEEADRKFAQFEERYNEEFDYAFKQLSPQAQAYIEKASLMHASPGEMVNVVSNYLKPIDKIRYEINAFISEMMSFAVQMAERYGIPLPSQLTKMPSDLPLSPPVDEEPQTIFHKAGSAMFDGFSAVGDAVGFIPEKLGVDYTDPNDDAISGIGATGLAVGAINNWMRNKDFTKAQTQFENQYRYFEIKNNGMDNENDILSMVIKGLKTANNRVTRTITVISSEIKRYEDMDLF
jgi:hypothetical protein